MVVLCLRPRIAVGVAKGDSQNICGKMRAGRDLEDVRVFNCMGIEVTSDASKVQHWWVSISGPHVVTCKCSIEDEVLSR